MITLNHERNYTHYATKESASMKRGPGGGWIVTGPNGSVSPKTLREATAAYEAVIEKIEEGFKKP